MKKCYLLTALCCFVLSSILLHANVANENDYNFLQEIRSSDLKGSTTGWQDLKYSGSRTGTTEFLIVSFSHGNPSCSQMKHIFKHKTQGGGWTKAVTAGNDDKSAEVWMRYVTSSNVNSLGQLDTGGAGAVHAGVLVYDGEAQVTNTADVTQCSTTGIEIDSNGSGPYLVIAASDNGTPESDKAMYHFSPGDDRVFIYLTDDRTFDDNTTGNLRGAIASLSLAGGSGSTPPPPPSSDNPDVSFHTPSGNVTLNEGDDLYVRVNASDSDGIDRVRLYKDGVQLNRSEGGSPYEWNASGQDDPELRNLSAGTFTLTARATDDVGDIGEASITVTVNGGSTPPPPPPPGGVDATLISKNSTWKYLDNGSNQGTGWRATGFNDGSWSSGTGPLGYGDSSSQNTTIGYGGDSENKHTTTYFRKSFSIGDASAYQAVELNVRRDDGVVVYLNGTEVARDNMPSGSIAYDTKANARASGDDETTYHSFFVNSSLLVNGTNVLAAEVHQDSDTSSDLSFDAELTAISDGSEPPPDNSTMSFTSKIKKGPYLIYDNVPGTMRVLWQTDGSAGGSIDWGTSSNYGNSGSARSLGNDQYEYSISGLPNRQKIYYRVNVGGQSSRSFFYSVPAEDSQETFTMYAVADSRGDPDVQGSIMQRIVDDMNVDQLRRQTCLMVAGDLVSTGGSESNWQNHWFARSQTGTLRLQSMVPFMASGGNHENYSEIVHFETFRKYYPYDYQDNTGTGRNGAFYITNFGPVLILNIDTSLGGSVPDFNDGGGIQLNDQQYNFILSSLQNTDKIFKMAVYHEPAYSANGGHSDNESEMKQAREVLAPLFEDYGVKLAWAGHNHYYSRHLVNGVHHVTTGGLGAPLRDPGTGVGLQKKDKSYHYVKMDLDPSSAVVTCRAIRLDGSEIESWQVQYEDGVTPPPSGDPLVSFDTPSGNVSIDEGDNLYVKVNASDPNGINRVRLYLDGVELTRSEGAAPYEWGATNQNDPELQNMQSGSYVLTARATDGAGDVGEDSIIVTVNDGSAPPPPPPGTPSVSFDRPVGDVTVNEGDSLYVKVNASDPDGINRVRLYKDGVELKRSEGSAPYEWGASNQNDPEISSLSAGSFELTVRATDNVGDVGEASITVTVGGSTPPSGAAPSVSFANPAGNTTIAEGSDLYVKINAVDPDGIDRVRLYKDGVELKRSEGIAPYEWGAAGQNDPEISSLSSGSFLLTARATDDSGDVGEASVVITVSGGSAPPPPPTGGSNNDSMFITWDLPGSVNAGQSFTVNVTWLNTGDSIWSRGEGYKSGSMGPRDNTTWGLNRAWLGASDIINPGETHTFSLECVAPGSAGLYDFQRQLVREGVQWFGETSPVEVIEVK